MRRQNRGSSAHRAGRYVYAFLLRRSGRQDVLFDADGKYDKMTALLAERGVTIPLRHICNSAGIMEFDDHHFEMVRSGIITYGIYPSEEVKRAPRSDPGAFLEEPCHPCEGSRPGHRRQLRCHVCDRETDDTDRNCFSRLCRRLSESSLEPGLCADPREKAPIIGRICMDQMMVDVTDIPDVQVEDVVTLVGTDGMRPSRSKRSPTRRHVSITRCSAISAAV